MKTYDEVKMILSAIEPSEAMYENFTSEDIPNLQKILKEPEPWLASRAVFVLSKLKSEQVNQILFGLVADPRVEIRVSLAYAASQLPSDISQKITGKLMEDPDAGVRKFAYSSVLPNASPDFTNRLKEVMNREELPALREILRKKIAGINDIH